MANGGGSDKTDGQALLAGGQPEAEGDVGFACARGAKDVMSKTCLRHDDILMPFNLLAGRRLPSIAVRPFAPRHFQHLHLVQRRDRLEVEAVQTPDGGEFGSLDPVAPSRRVNTPARQRAGHCAAMAREGALDQPMTTLST